MATPKSAPSGDFEEETLGSGAEGNEGGLEGDGVRKMNALLEFQHVCKGAKTRRGNERVSDQTLR